MTAEEREIMSLYPDEEYETEEVVLTPFAGFSKPEKHIEHPIHIVSEKGVLVNDQDTVCVFNDGSDFASEKEYVSYIIANIRGFCQEALDDEYVSHETEKRLLPLYIMKGSRGNSNSRIDIFVTCKNGNYAIEVKNPKDIYSDLSRAVGQVLAYSVLLEEKGIKARQVIVSSRHDSIITKVLNRYNLGIGYIVFNRRSMAIYER